MQEGIKWEQVLEIARQLDSNAAARKGVESALAIRLARAVLALQRQIDTGLACLPPDPALRPDGE